MSKQDIRRRVKALKSELSQEQRVEAARQAFKYVENLNIFDKARNILVYNSLPDELPTAQFITAHCADKNLYLPRVNGDDLDILPYDPNALGSGAFGICEPTGDDIVDIAKMDLIIVPGVAFDRLGNRIGRGKGFYDRLLKNTSAPTIGIGYACQICDDIVPESFDIALHYIITDQGVVHQP